MTNASETAETIAIEVPAQPTNHSIVLDAQGWSWQRFGGNWYSVRPTGIGDSFAVAFTGLTGKVVTSRAWLGLLADFGPVTVVHRAQPADSDGED